MRKLQAVIALIVAVICFAAGIEGAILIPGIRDKVIAVVTFFALGISCVAVVKSLRKTPAERP